MSTLEERLAVVEARQKSQEEWLRSIDEKLDKVVAAINMGRGAWLAIIRMGAIIVPIAGFFAWAADKIGLWK